MMHNLANFTNCYRTTSSKSNNIYVKLKKLDLFKAFIIWIAQPIYLSNKLEFCINQKFPCSTTYNT